MSDRKLLELAAKAAGFPLSPEWDGATVGIMIGTGAGDLTHWNPLDDDGEALRLAVKLRLKIDLETSGVVYVSNFDSVAFVQEDCGSDPASATRRAIVRAAAEIGRGM